MADETRCVLTLPLLTEPWQEHILEKRFAILEHLQNSLIGFELRKLKNLQRTRAWKDLEKRIRETLKGTERNALYRQRNVMLKDAGFPNGMSGRVQFEKDINPMQKHFVEHVTAQIAHKLAANVWQAFEGYLYQGNGRQVHFKRRGSLQSIANKTNGNSMRICISEGKYIFRWSGGKCKKPNKPVDIDILLQPPRNRYEEEMLAKECKYFRVVRRWMKTRYKYYLQLTLVGAPSSKNRPAAPGRVGIDIGTQSIAIASNNGVHLLELADRVNRNHDRMLTLQRKMDASRRSTNPENYNPDGTVRRGIRLRWMYSGHYRRAAGQVRELQRKNADIRKYQHTCLANYILSLGGEVYVEQMDFRALQKRAKETQIGPDGRYRKKKRFGKSLANKAPSMFLTILDTKLRSRGTELHRVDTWEFRASQYDHLSRKYKKKALSQRTHRLENGDDLQRDLYSAFLLMNAAEDRKHPDQLLCEQNYPQFKELHDEEIRRLRTDGRTHLSSFGVA